MKEKESDRPTGSAGKTPQRAQRLEIKVPVRYREINQGKWHEGRTENISQSGILFRAPEPLCSDTLIEMNFALPANKEGEPGTTVLCDGKTIRTILPSTSDQSPGVAVKIMNCKLKLGE